MGGGGEGGCEALDGGWGYDVLVGGGLVEVNMGIATYGLGFHLNMVEKMALRLIISLFGCLVS